MRHTALMAMAFLLATPAPAAEPNPLLELLAKTKFVWVSDYTGPVTEFKEDTDPLTVEIVLLKDPKQGASHVSEDGQVIFARATDGDPKTQTMIIESAERRLKALSRRA